MTIPLRQSTASQEVTLGYFVDSTDGNTEETGLSIANTDIKVWKAGATTLADKNSGGATHISNGIYYAVLDATDTDTLGPLVLFVHVAGALSVRLQCVVHPASVYDALYGTATLPADVTKWNGTAVATPDTAGQPKVTVASGTGAGQISLSSGAVTAGTVSDKTGYSLASAPPTAAAVADAVWDEARADHTAAGSFGQGAASVQGNVTGSVGSVTGAVGSVTGAVGSVTGGVTITTNNDKTGYGLSAAAVDAVLDDAVEGSITARQVMRALLAFVAGKANGGGSTPVVYRDQADTKDRISMSVDTNGNRSAVTTDLT